MKIINTGLVFLLLVFPGLGVADSQDPLADAIVDNDVAEVRLLLADGEYAPVDAFSYLSAALQLDSTRILQALLEFGLPADARADGALRATAMMYAAYMDRPDMMQVLSDAGADIDLPDEMGDPPINWAAYGGKPAAIGWLLTNNARLDQVGHGTALQIAKRRGFTEIVEMIAARELSIDMTHDARLLAAAIDANDTNNAIELVKAGGNGAAIDNTGRPLFHRAARQNRVDIVEAMLVAGIDVNLQDDIGFTALMEAAREAHSGMADVLLAAGADANTVSNPGALNMTPIHLAGIGGSSEIIVALSEAGANLDAQDTDGASAMIWALSEGNRDAAMQMQQLGADPDLENRFGDSATSILEYLDSLE